MATKNAPEHVQRWRDNHHRALATLATNGKSGKQIWQALNRLEQTAHHRAEQYCNGHLTMEQTNDFPGYTNQEAYNIVCLHLAKQKRRCTLRGVVVLRNDNKRDPLGKLLPDHLYSEELAHAHATDLPKGVVTALLPWTPYREAIALLTAFEDVHDDADIHLPSGKVIDGHLMAKAMAKQLRMTADRFNLDAGAEKKLEGIYWKG